MKRSSAPADLLSKVIREQEVSQNSLIRSAGIDRSSYYQMLSGKRLRTLEQFTAILSQLKLSPELAQQLAAEYAKRKFGEDFQLCEQIDRWMQKLSDVNQSPLDPEDIPGTDHESTEKILGKEYRSAEDAARKLRQLICTEEESPEEADLCLYISLELFSFFWMQTDILKLLGTLAQTRRVRILVSVHQGDGSIGADTSRRGDSMEIRLALLFSFLYGLVHVRHFADMVSLNYVRSGTQDTPYPYFVIASHQVCLFPAEGTGVIALKQKKVIARYRCFFDSLGSTSYEYLENHDSLEDFMRSLYRRFAENSGMDRKNRMAQHALCIFQVADRDQITRYADASLREFLLSYKEMFTQMQSVFLNFYSAVQEFLLDRRVMENGFTLVLDPEDVEKICRQAENPDRDDILLLTGGQDHLPGNWAFALFSSGELMILPNWDCRWIISIRSQELFHAFSVWFDVNREMTLVLRKLRLLQDKP